MSGPKALLADCTCWQHCACSTRCWQTGKAAICVRDKEEASAMLRMYRRRGSGAMDRSRRVSDSDLVKQGCGLAELAMLADG